MTTPTLSVAGPNDAELLERAKDFAEACRNRAGVWFSIATAITDAFGLNGGGPVAVAEQPAQAEPVEEKPKRQSGKPRTTKAPAPDRTAPAERRGGRQPRFNEDERSAIAEYANEHGATAAARHYECATSMVYRYMREFAA